MIYALNSVAPTLPKDGDFWIAPNANVVGNVTIGSGASVWFGCTLRGDNEPILLGDGSNIQDGCVLHTDPGFALTIGPNATPILRALAFGFGVWVSRGLTRACD